MISYKLLELAYQKPLLASKNKTCQKTWVCLDWLILELMQIKKR